MRTCPGCHKDLPEEIFISSSGRRYPRCRPCRNAAASSRNKERYQTDPEFRKKIQAQNNARYHANKADPAFVRHRRSMSMLQSYGVTMDYYEHLYRKQKGHCAICRKRYPIDGPRGGRLEIDHCHETGKVRGLLCRRCNDTIGKLLDSPVLLERALKYLTR